jgi:hypothetical protein
VGRGKPGLQTVHPTLTDDSMGLESLSSNPSVFMFCKDNCIVRVWLGLHLPSMDSSEQYFNIARRRPLLHLCFYGDGDATNPSTNNCMRNSLPAFGKKIVVCSHPLTPRERYTFSTGTCLLWLPTCKPTRRARHHWSRVNHGLAKCLIADGCNRVKET